MGNGASAIMSNRVDILRSPSVVGGMRGQPEAHLSEVPCTSLLPVSSEVAARLPNLIPSEILQVFIPKGYDVKEGDILVSDSKNYPIREASEWSMRSNGIVHLLLEDEKVS